VGNLCGTHKLIPAISPHKTWEGFLGGWATVSIMLGGAYAVWGNSVAWISCVYQCCFFIIFGGGIAVAGLCGDLYISLLKRRAGVKDTGNLLPGHGGLLDRLDSILAVTLYIWWYKTTLLALFG
jgi:phosphatidate cytidylyltransferase